LLRIALSCTQLQASERMVHQVILLKFYIYYYKSLSYSESILCLDTTRVYLQVEAETRRFETEVIGSTHLKLIGGEVCWRQKCNLGNLVTDAMVHCVLNAHHYGSIRIPRSQPIFSLWHAGALYKDDIDSDGNWQLYGFDVYLILEINCNEFYL